MRITRNDCDWYHICGNAYVYRFIRACDNWKCYLCEPCYKEYQDIKRWVKEGRYRVKVKGVDALKALIEGKTLKQCDMKIKINGHYFVYNLINDSWFLETELTIHDFMHWEFEIVEPANESN